MFLGRLALAYRAAMRARMHESGQFTDWELRPPSIGVLRVVEAYAPVSQREVGERLGVHPSDMVRAVDQLEEHGLVTRVRSQTDRRRYDLTVTVKGRSVLERFATLAEEVDQEFYGVLTAAEQRQLEKLMTKLIGHHFA